MTDIFKTDDLPVIDPEKDYFTDLVGEGKKYTDQRAAGRALMEKDLFIERLKRENAGIRQELSSRAAIEDTLKKIDEKIQPRETPPNHGGDRVVEQQAPTVDPQTLEAKIAELMNQRDTQRTLESNERAVQDRLRKVFGDNYQTHVSQKASELGVGTEFLSDLARRQPQAFFAILGVDENKPIDRQVVPPQATFRPTSGANGMKTYSYYENIRKTNPSEYWKPAVQNEMFRQLEELGQEDFYK